MPIVPVHFIELGLDVVRDLGLGSEALDGPLTQGEGVCLEVRVHVRVTYLGEVLFGDVHFLYVYEEGYRTLLSMHQLSRVMHLISPKQDSFAKLRSKYLLNHHLRPLLVHHERAPVGLLPPRVQIHQVCEEARVLAVDADLAVDQGVAMRIAVHLELAALVIVQVLLLDLRYFVAQRQLFVYCGSKKLDPVLEPDSIGQLREVLLLQEREPVYLADPVIVVIVPIGHGVPTVPLYQAVDEVLRVVLLDPEHLLKQAAQEVLFEEVVVFNVVRLVIDQAADVAVHLRGDEFVVRHGLAVDVGDGLLYDIRGYCELIGERGIDKSRKGRGENHSQIR